MKSSILVDDNNRLTKPMSENIPDLSETTEPIIPNSEDLSRRAQQMQTMLAELKTTPPALTEMLVMSHKMEMLNAKSDHPEDADPIAAELWSELTRISADHFSVDFQDAANELSAAVRSGLAPNLTEAAKFIANKYQIDSKNMKPEEDIELTPEDLAPDSFEEATTPEVLAATDPEVQSKLVVLGETERKAGKLDLILPFFESSGPRVGGGESVGFNKIVASLEASVNESEQDLEIAKLKAEIKELNKVVQKSEAMEKFGSEHGFDKNATYAFIENKVLENEKRIKALEENKKFLEIEAKNREKYNEIARLKAEINELNKIVQNSQAMEKFGAENGFDKNKTYAYIEHQILENEKKIRELEDSLKADAKKTVDVAPAKPEDVVVPVEAEKAKKQEFGEEWLKQVRVEALKKLENENAPSTPIIPIPISPEGGEDGVGEDEIKRKTEPLPAQAGPVLVEAYEDARGKKSWWGWIKERAKGFGTLGIWEFYQAERFRSNKNITAEEIAEAGERIRKVDNLSLEDALAEAETMHMMAEGADIANPESPDYDKFSNIISKHKIEENNKRIDVIITESSAALKERLAKYRDVSGEQVALDARIMDGFEQTLRNSLLGLEDGLILSDAKEFSKVINDRIDPTYWKRYVYGGVEAVLGQWGIKVLVAKGMGWWFGKKGAEAVLDAGADAGVDAVADAGAEVVFDPNQIPMKDHIWGTAKEWLKERGITNPSDSELMKVAKQVATDNNIGVKEWGIPGDPLDTGTQQGHLLKFGGASKILLALKVARGIAKIIS